MQNIFNCGEIQTSVLLPIIPDKVLNIYGSRFTSSVAYSGVSPLRHEDSHNINMTERK